jgi:hypothetical protein
MEEEPQREGRGKGEWRAESGEQRIEDEGSPEIRET